MKHTGAPLNVQWSEDSTMLKTFNKNYEVCHFTVDKKKKAATFVPNVPDPGMCICVHFYHKKNKK